MCKLVNYSSTDVPTVCETVAIQFPFTVHPFVLPALCPKLMQSALSTILLIHHNATNQCSLCAPLHQRSAITTTLYHSCLQLY